MSNPIVAEELKHIRQKVDQHDQLLVRVVELQERLVAQGDRQTEHMDRTEKRFDKIEDKLDEHIKDSRGSVSRAHERIDENKNTILRWSGGIAAIVALVGFIAMMWRTWGG